MLERYGSHVNPITTRGYYNYWTNKRNYPMGLTNDPNGILDMVIEYNNKLGRLMR